MEYIFSFIPVGFHQKEFQYFQVFHRKPVGMKKKNHSLVLPRCKCKCYLLQNLRLQSSVSRILPLIIMPVIWITERSGGAFRAFRGLLVVCDVSLKAEVVFCVSALVLEAPARQRSAENGQFPEQHLLREGRRQVGQVFGFYSVCVCVVLMVLLRRYVLELAFIRFIHSQGIMQ